MSSVDRRKQILDLEKIVTELSKAARKLPRGPERHGILKEIGLFRARVTALRHSEEPNDQT
jgi:hypothetical protein